MIQDLISSCYRFNDLQFSRLLHLVHHLLDFVVFHTHQIKATADFRDPQLDFLEHLLSLIESTTSSYLL